MGKRMMAIKSVQKLFLKYKGKNIVLYKRERSMKSILGNLFLPCRIGNNSFYNSWCLHFKEEEQNSNTDHDDK